SGRSLAQVVLSPVVLLARHQSSPSLRAFRPGHGSARTNDLGFLTGAAHRRSATLSLSQGYLERLSMGTRHFPTPTDGRVRARDLALVFRWNRETALEGLAAAYRRAARAGGVIEEMAVTRGASRLAGGWR